MAFGSRITSVFLVFRFFLNRGLRRISLCNFDFRRKERVENRVETATSSQQLDSSSRRAENVATEPGLGYRPAGEDGDDDGVCGQQSKPTAFAAFV